jgi:L-fuculose-phosphate aldolase
MVLDGLVIGTAGNISIRRDDEIVITPSSVPYELIEPDDLCVTDLDGRTIAGRRSPSAETPLHAAIYRTTTAAAVVHTHSPFATTLACTIDELPAIHYAIHRFGGDSIPVTRYERFGSQGLANAVASALGDRKAVLLRNHGAVVHGSSVVEAYELAQLLEWLSRLYWHARVLGNPRILTREELLDVAAESQRRQYGLGSPPA